MKLIFRIAKSELRYYFFSPIAWFVLLVFLFVNGSIAYKELLLWAGKQDYQIELHGTGFAGFPMLALTKVVLLSSMYDSFKLLFLFVPLLTMNVINREYAYGTMKLLNSSPVSIGKIVFGKFFGIMFFMLMMIGLYALVYLVAGATINEAEYALIFTTCFSFILTAAFYVAVGIYISSVTASPLLASIITLVVLAFFSLSENFFQSTPYIGELMYAICTSNRATNLFDGLITSYDLMFYFGMIGMFLLFTIIKMSSAILISSRWKLLSRYAITMLVTIAIVYAASFQRNTLYWDATRGNTNTAHDQVQKLIKELDGSPLEVTLYTNLFGYNLEKGLPNKINNYKWNFWDRYQRFYPNINYNYVYYYDIKDGDSTIFKTYPGKDLEEIAIEYAKMADVPIERFLRPEAIRQMIDLSNEEKGLLMTVAYKDKRAILRTYADIEVWPEDTHIIGALQRLATDTMPRVKYLTGNYERSPFKKGEREYGRHLTNVMSRGSLLNLGILADTISTVDLNRFIKEDVLVIADPKSNYSDELINQINKYIDAGRNAIFFTEPGKQNILNPVFNHIGFNAEPGILVWNNPKDIPVNFMVEVAPKILEDLADTYILERRLKQDLHYFMYGTTHFNILAEHFKMDTLGRIDNPTGEIWSERTAFVVDSAQPVFDPLVDVKVPGNYLTALKMSRVINNETQRLIAFADSDAISNGMYSNFDLKTGIYNYVFNYKYPVYTNEPPLRDISLKVTESQVNLLLIFFKYILTGVILLTGIIVLLRRSRK